MRLGDLDELKKALSKYAGFTEKIYLNEFIKEIDNAPTVKNEYMRGYEAAEREYKRPQGEWVRTGSLGNGNAHYECSNCHYGDEHAESQEVPYCWHCGAKMKGGTE